MDSTSWIGAAAGGAMEQTQNFVGSYLSPAQAEQRKLLTQSRKRLATGEGGYTSAKKDQELGDIQKNLYAQQQALAATQQPLTTGRWGGRDVAREQAAQERLAAGAADARAGVQARSDAFAMQQYDKDVARVDQQAQLWLDASQRANEINRNTSNQINGGSSTSMQGTPSTKKDRGGIVSTATAVDAGG